MAAIHTGPVLGAFFCPPGKKTGLSLQFLGPLRGPAVFPLYPLRGRKPAAAGHAAPLFTAGENRYT
jgi:hypothetical protein